MMDTTQSKPPDDKKKKPIHATERPAWLARMIAKGWNHNVQTSRMAKDSRQALLDFPCTKANVDKLKGLVEVADMVSENRRYILIKLLEKLETQN
jgi:hypothetical protein